jgi:hypothetical protein
MASCFAMLMCVVPSDSIPVINFRQDEFAFHGRTGDLAPLYASAWLAAACLVAGAVLFLVPVTVHVRSTAHHRVIAAQRCGTPAKFLLDGRADQPVSGLDAQETAAYDRHPCSSEVADQAGPGGALLLATFVLALLAFALAVIGHRADQRRRLKAALAGGRRPPLPPTPTPSGWGPVSSGAPGSAQQRPPTPGPTRPDHQPSPEPRPSGRHDT